MTNISIKGSLHIKGNQDGITHAERSLTVKQDGVTLIDIKPKTPRLTDTQKRALRLCWLADRNCRHADLTMILALGYRSSYSDSDGHVRTGCDLTRYPTMKKLIDLGLIKWVDTYTVHITDTGRFAADVYGFTE